MTRTSPIAFQETQPYVRTHAAARRAGHARRRTMLTLACIAGGVGGGVALKQPAPQRAPVAIQAASPTPVQAQQPTVEVQVEAQQPDTEAAAEAQQETAPVVAVAIPAPDQIRSQLRWVNVQGTRTLDANSRLLLTRSAAQRADLADVGLDYRDVYGVIHAESSWVARPGMGRNGVVSQGLAQFEPATARAVGLRNPADPVEAVHAAALLLKEAARWSARKLEGLNLDAAQRALRLREGVSVYYNLSTRGRNAWHGFNSQQMPIETRLHIRNVRDGALRAGQLTGDTDARVANTSVDVASLPHVQVHVQAQATKVAAAAAPTRTRVTFSGAPQRAPSTAHSWIRTKDAITTPEGSIRWTSRNSAS